MGEMKMKKRISILICLILATSLLIACSSGDNYGGATESWVGDMNDAMPMPAPAAEAPQMARRVSQNFEHAEAVMYDEIDYIGGADSGYNHNTGGSAGGGTIVPVTAPMNEGLAEKIIYSVYANIETMQFDETIAKVHGMLAMYNAFIENSSVSGINYESQFYGWNEFRYAYFSLRVPVQNLNAMTDNLKNLGNVTHTSNDAMNITTQFYDTQSRLNSLNIQEERLLDMLSKAEDVPDLIMIEERLSDVRYQIEMLTTTLTGWQRQVDYSTLTLQIREVEEFTEQPVLNPSYWTQIADGFMSSIQAIGRFFMNLFKWLIVNAPILIILAIVAVAALLVIRWKLRSIKKRKEENVVTEEPEDTQE